MTGKYTLDQTEHAVADRLADLALDLSATAVVSSLYRAAGAVRNHFERQVLTPHRLTWTGWVVLWVIWVWESVESRHVAAEAGISKSTLTGVVTTLERRHLVRRLSHPDDGRRVVLTLTSSGQELMCTVLPLINQCESDVLAGLKAADRDHLTEMLRQIVLDLERPHTEGPPTVVPRRGPAR